MKKLIILFIMTCALNSYAEDCRKAYSTKAIKRDRTHTVLIIAPIATTAAASIATAGATLPLFWGTLLPALTLTNADLTNQFKRIELTLEASHANNLEDRNFQRFAELVRVKLFEIQASPVSDLEISMVLNEENFNQTICPLIKLKKDGTEKRSVFTKDALAILVALKLTSIR